MFLINRLQFRCMLSTCDCFSAATLYIISHVTRVSRTAASHVGFKSPIELNTAGVQPYNRLFCVGLY